MTDIISIVEQKGEQVKKAKKEKKPKKKTKMLHLQYIKKDKYGNDSFLVSDDSDVLKPSYEKSKNYYKILKKKYDSNPFWFQSGKKYGTVRLKKNDILAGAKLEPRSIYQVSFGFYENKMNEKKYISMLATNIKFVSTPSIGESVEVNSDDDVGDDDDDDDESSNESD